MIKKNLLVKVVSLVLAGTMMFGIVGCGNTDDKESTNAKTSETAKTSEVEKETSETASTTVEEVVELTYPLDTDVTFSCMGINYNAFWTSFEESAFHQGLEKKTGVKVEWEKLVWDQLPLVLAEPKDRPDAFGRGWVSSAEIAGWIEDEVIIELTDYLPEYAPDFWEFINLPENDATKRAITDEEGRFWYLPGLSELESDINYTGPVIRKDWLDECGLDIPVTLDELENVLVKFKEKYGATFMGTYANFKEYGFGSGTDAFASMIARQYVDDNGQVQLANAQPEWKELLEYYARWYDMGLVDADFITADNALARQKALDGKIGLVFVPQSQMTLLLQDAEDNKTGAEWVAISYPRTSKDAPTKLIQSGGSKYSSLYSAFITTSCEEEKIPVILSWMNYFFTEEGKMYTNFGEEGVTYTLDADGNVKFTELITADPLGAEGVLPRYAVWGSNSLGMQTHKFKVALNRPDVLKANEIWTDNTVAGQYFVPTNLPLSADDAIVYADAYTAIQTYVEQMAIKFMTGEASLEKDWDSYLAELDKLGLKDVLSIQQAAYENYMSK